MKKLILLFLFVAFLMSCEKDNKASYEVTNLSGVDWYEAQIWYSNSGSSDAEFTGYDNVGSVLIGESVKFTTDNTHILIMAKSNSGGSVMSKRIAISGSKISVSKSDLSSY